MALAKTDDTILELRGRFGGVYFKKDAAGQHIQAMPRSVRKASMRSPVTPPESPGGSRAAGIGGFTAASIIAVLIMAAVLLTLWVAYAVSKWYMTKRNEKKRLEARKWILHFNIMREAKNLPSYTTPPIEPTDLPEFVIAGPHFEKWTQNMYMQPNEIGGKPWYKRPYTEVDPDHFSLWYHEGTWYISMWPEWPPSIQYWWLESENPIGKYTPHVAADGPLTVNL